MDKWEMLDVLMHMRGVAIEMMEKHLVEQKHGDFMKGMTRWDVWNDLEDKLHDKWKRLHNEVVIEKGLPAHFLMM